MWIGGLISTRASTVTRRGSSGRTSARSVALFRSARRRPEQLDLSVIKNTRVSERTQLQFRAEAINALNHPQFTAPNTTPTSTAFGTVTGEFAWPRVIQFGLKALF